ncbi:MAG: sugar phosphate isomerase/epimerase family protein [Bryobacteraceae bacterium]
MKFGVNTLIWSEGFDAGHVKLFPSIKEAGFDGLEFPLFTPEPRPNVEIRRGLEQNDLECTFCSILPAGLNTISDDRDVRSRSKQYWADTIRTVAEMGGKILCGPLYSPVGHFAGRRRTPDEWRWAVECFRDLGSTLTEYDVMMAIEPLNRYETYFLNTAADSVDLCREVDHPNVGMLFDTYHANIEEKHVGEALRQSKPYLRHLHTCENDRGIPGTGHVDWDSVFATVREVNYDGWLTIEGFGFSLGALSSAASIWRDLAPTSGAIAFEGIKFLKARMKSDG